MTSPKLAAILDRFVANGADLDRADIDYSQGSNRTSIVFWQHLETRENGRAVKVAVDGFDTEGVAPHISLAKTLEIPYTNRHGTQVTATVKVEWEGGFSCTKTEDAKYDCVPSEFADEDEDDSEVDDGGDPPF